MMFLGAQVEDIENTLDLMALYMYGLVGMKKAVYGVKYLTT